MSEQIQIEMYRDEAVVLFAYLSRVNENAALDPTFESPAEQMVLWNLQAIFEKQLIEPFAKDYNKIVTRARKTLMESGRETEEETKQASHPRSR